MQVTGWASGALHVVRAQVVEEVVDLALIGGVQSGVDKAREVGTEINGDLGLSEVSVSGAGDRVGVQAQFLPGDARHLVEHQGNHIVDLEGSLFSAIHDS